MKQNNPNLDPESPPGNIEINFQELIWSYIRKWPWFIAGLALSFYISFTYLKHTPKLYEASATILIKDRSGNKSPDEFSTFRDIGIFGADNTLENEIEIMKSRSLMSRVVNDLSLYYDCYIDKSPIDLPLYKATPIYINFTGTDSAGPSMSGEFLYKRVDDTFFEIIRDKKNKKYKYGEEINIGFGKFSITQKKPFNEFSRSVIHVFIYPEYAVAAAYSGQLKIEPVNSKSDVLRLSMKNPVKARATDIINSLIHQYQIDCYEEKNLSSRATAAFINDRIKYITTELSDVEGKVKRFKTEQGLIDIPLETGLHLQNESEIEKQITQSNLQLELAKYMYDYLVKNKSSEELLPVNLGLEDNYINASLDNHNTLVSQAIKLQKGGTSENPVILQYQEQILSLRKNIRDALKNLITTNQLRLSELKKQEREIQGKISSVPGIEKEFREIQRQQQIKETLYLYLLQKREENAIASTFNVSNSKVIDEAYSSGRIVSPQKSLIYTMAFFAGLILPLFLLNLFNVLNDKVTDRKSVENLPVPFLGYIPSHRGKEKLVIKINENSTFAESFRSIRTNLSFFLPEAKKCKSIFITSSVTGEGKTFVSINLAAIYAATGKKVVIVGMDLRKQKVMEYLDIPNGRGLSNLLVSTQTKIEDCLIKVPGFETLFVLPPGPIPPNPAELLMLPRTKEIFDALNEMFDILIVDTPPVGVVSDTLIISENADAVVYLVRSGYSKKNTLKTPVELNHEKKLPQLSVLLNDVNIYRSYRDYHYGYGYTEKPRPWYKRLV